MMKAKIAAICLALAALFSSSCEQHKWEETQKLFKNEHAAHGDKTTGHDEKKADGHGEAK